jgi:crotonobetainyl-CoA:carnitine CoA-transferase CaiB-like acyl-CoA transferase
MLPLAGVRILAVEVYGAGPFGTAHLADLGAEVIKIEPRDGGDVSRSVGPLFLGEDDSVFFQSLNRNKKSLALDLKHPKGREVLEKLAATADGLLSNLRGDQPEKLRIRHADLAHANPKLVCAHLSAYGRDGARKSWPGYDYLMQGEAGFLGLSGEPDGPPARMGLSIVDYSTGTTCALALLAGVLEARRTGKGRDLDVSLYDVAMHLLNYPAAWYLNDGLVTERLPRSAHPFIVPSQLYRTQDGWIFVMAQTQGFWEKLCDALGRGELKVRYPDFESRREHRDELTRILDAEFGKRTTEAWLARLRGTIPCAPVYDLPQALENPYFLGRGGVQVFDHPDKPGFKLVASPFRLDEPLPANPAPKLGEHTAALLAELGYSAADIAALKASKAAG